MIRSVRGRLTLWYGAALLLILSCYAGGAYVFLARQLDAEMDRTLRMDFEAAEELARGGEKTSDHDHGPRRWIEVRARGGNVFVRRGPEMKFPETGEGTESVELRTGEVVRILTNDYALEDRIVRIRVARSEERMRADLSQFLLVLAIALPLALAASAVAGYFLAGRALAPVERIVTRAEAITAERLRDRLPVENPADELGRLATAFNGMFARLERSFEEMRRFTGDAAHELRTPLTAMRSVGEVCLRDGGSDARGAITSMLEEVERMTRLVDGMLRLARADGGAAEPALRTVELGVFAQELVGRLGLEADVDAPEAVPVQADPDLLEQALGNLLDNAVRHSPEHVRVRVRAPGIVEVVDRGEGIAPEHLERVFERFYRVDEARARSTGGAGLGLAIARWAVEAQGGRIEVQSEPGQGATFRIVLA